MNHVFTEIQVVRQLAGVSWLLCPCRNQAVRDLNKVNYIFTEIPGSETAGRQAGCADVWPSLLCSSGILAARDLNKVNYVFYLISR
jgi:hypothetical protein